MIRDLALTLVGTLVRVPDDLGGYLAIVTDSDLERVECQVSGITLATDRPGVWVPTGRLEYVAQAYRP